MGRVKQLIFPGTAILLSWLFVSGLSYESSSRNGFHYTVNGEMEYEISEENVIDHGEELGIVMTGIQGSNENAIRIITSDGIRINDSTTVGFNIGFYLKAGLFGVHAYEVSDTEENEGNFVSYVDYFYNKRDLNDTGYWQRIIKEYSSRSGSLVISEITANHVYGTFEIDYDLLGGTQDDYPSPGSSDEARSELDPKAEALTISGTFAIEI